MMLLLPAAPAVAAPLPELEGIVVTAPRMLQPLVITLDAKSAQQPVPANDGASFMRNTPGFNVIRKGGTDGDLVLRGLAGSRLNILLDGMDFHGGCGMRMDPPTAYVFPETYDLVRVIKGPQTVIHGNGNAAGVVLFEHDTTLPPAGGAGELRLLAGAWGRADLLGTASLAGERLFLAGTATHAESGNYDDGQGRAVHSAYTRQSGQIRLGYRPTADTRIDLDYTVSAAWAAYADRGMDGVVFDRDSIGLTLEKKHLSPHIDRLTFRLYNTYIDHVMDNYSMRANPGTATSHSVSNPDRDTTGARLNGALVLTDTLLLSLGADWRDDTHSLRQRMRTSLALAQAYTGLPRDKDFTSTITGVFAELTHLIAPGRRVIAGLRHDAWQADRFQSGSRIATSTQDLVSGFARYEQAFARLPATLYLGLGYNERAMDYWEAVNRNGLTPNTALPPEQTRQLDAGLIWQGDRLRASLALFHGRSDDFMLTAPSVTRTGGQSFRGLACTPMPPATTCTYNVIDSIKAVRSGAEADLAWRFMPGWTLRGGLAHVRGENRSRGVPLAQTPPLEGRLGLEHARGTWSVGGVLRRAARQERVDVGYGNIVGQDIGTTPGFTTLALNVGYRPSTRTSFSAGIDNLFDRDYAEHLSRAGAAVSGYLQTTRVNELGRFMWAKLSHQF